MNEIMSLIPIVIIAIGIIAILTGYVKAPTNKAYIITGIRRQPKVLIGKAGIKIPFLDRKDELIIKQISVDIKTNGYIPTQDFIGVDIDAIAKIQVDTSAEGMELATKNFLNMSEEQIVYSLTDSLQGNLREIIGTMTLKEISNDRKKFGDQIQEKAQNDMNALGIKIISCNVQKVKDENNLINALGQDNMSQIQKVAQIAKAEADRDVIIARANASKEANDVQVQAETEIARKKTELEIEQAELKKKADIKQAEADAAYRIQEEEQRKTVEITTANANLARQEKEIELKEREVAIQERTLEATIKKQAEAEKYAKQQEADAEQYEREKQAEAELFERQKQAEAEKFEAIQEAEAQKAKAEAMRFEEEQKAESIRANGLAEAEAVSAKGKAEAEAIQAKALAEAEGILKKAEAMKEYGEAARQQMELDTIKVYFEQLPKIAEAVGNGYANIDSIKMFGGDTSQLAGNIMTTLEQVSDGVGESLGLDMKSLIAGLIGGKIASNSSNSETPNIDININNSKDNEDYEDNSRSIYDDMQEY